ncbi:MAG: arsenic resistance protein, partial [Pseudomonadota bacterium]
APATTWTAALLFAAIAIGSIVGLASPATGDLLSQGVDSTLLVMIFLLFFELRFGAIIKALKNLRFLALAWCANFIFVPLIAFVIASVVLTGEPLLFAGLMIYFLAPCTDWFLGFTRMAQGDAELGAALIPVNLITQLLLFPLWLWVFTEHAGLVDFAAIPDLLAQWFLLPLLAAQLLRMGLEKTIPPRAFDLVMSSTGRLVPLSLAALILQLFAANIGVIGSNIGGFALIGLGVFFFFITTLVVGRQLAKLGRLDYPQEALLAMTMAARNAPMMLAVTAVAIPGEPLILAAIVFGMLIEIPHLTILRQLLLRRRSKLRRNNQSQRFGEIDPVS